MTVPIQHISADAQQFNWLINQFAANTPLVSDAIAVSSDGLLIAMTNSLERADADRLAAITSAIISLSIGAAQVYDLGSPNKVIIDLDRGYLLVSAISVGAALSVLAAKSANLGQLAYEMAMFANRAGAVLTPGLIEELKSTVGY
ncbi:roadblock/LC7 domain-containing protein [Dactylosporangium sucinum]|uniref:Dynein regulation protein LC7 n=1 Tax=Dactylosporangium sucinum TaxID=1424081 RepID=A0A917WX01_9ACTN|nr:roadblock/LC7 domain-containing protein [Dactylosporangium sucinum]GGM37641.1 dynein regulation protein LC7 [Dactylosporangium sucinum]